jgi:uncharacterized membrane protein HdeD (DUF308 family)
MILRVLGLYLVIEGVGNVVYYRGDKSLRNYVFQAGRIARAAIGVFLILL